MMVEQQSGHDGSGRVMPVAVSDLHGEHPLISPLVAFDEAFGFVPQVAHGHGIVAAQRHRAEEFSGGARPVLEGVVDDPAPGVPAGPRVVPRRVGGCEQADRERLLCHSFSHRDVRAGVGIPWHRRLARR